ncbi:hypothetical protein RHGRI_020847 [Rhododendron griersonianum]|uniref:Uncharacterized protein n=1 Tax=Rhododendron griersonianum TaxID=479676 RepID=A0AAV6JM71_9ERIC|nr:hypothetical protein RHGRI_020847 [Rhododendron griersonianum]
MAISEALEVLAPAVSSGNSMGQARVEISDSKPYRKRVLSWYGLLRQRTATMMAVPRSSRQGRSSYHSRISRSGFESTGVFTGHELVFLL